MIVPFLAFRQRRIDGGMVVEYLRPAWRRYLFCDDEHDGSFAKQPTFACNERSH
jgi:hypothetical protein